MSGIDSPIINQILTLLDQAGVPVVPQLDSTGRFRVNVGTSINTPAQPTPPASPSDGDVWYNNAPNQNMLYTYSATLGVWLSPEFTLLFGEDGLDGNRAGWAGINNAGNGTTMLMPRDALLTAVTAKIRAGNNTKQFFLEINGVNTPQDLVGGQLISFPNLNIDAGQEFWIVGNGAGQSVQDVVFTTFWRWRVNP